MCACVLHGCLVVAIARGVMHRVGCVFPRIASAGRLVGQSHFFSCCSDIGPTGRWKTCCTQCFEISGQAAKLFLLVCSIFVHHLCLLKATGRAHRAGDPQTQFSRARQCCLGQNAATAGQNESVTQASYDLVGPGLMCPLAASGCTPGRRGWRRHLWRCCRRGEACRTSSWRPPWWTPWAPTSSTAQSAGPCRSDAPPPPLLPRPRASGLTRASVSAVISARVTRPR